MSDEQKDEIQEEKPEQKDEEPKKEEEKKYTDDDVDSIINKKFAKWKAETDKAIAEAKAEGDGLTLTFAAEGFSVYAIVDAPEAYEPEITTVSSLEEFTNIEDLEETGFYLSVGNPKKYFSNRVKNNCLEEEPTWNGAAVWYFEPIEGQTGEYYIYTLINGVKNYIKQRNANNNNISLASTGTAVTLENGGTGTFYIKHAGEGKWLQHSNSGGGIRFYTDHNNAANSKITMTYASSVSVPDDCYGLDGQSFGITYDSESIFCTALMSDSPAEGCLTGQDMAKMDTQGYSERLFVPLDSDITDWTFTNVEGDKYYITTTVDGDTKYLTIENGSASLSSTAQEGSLIQVIPGTGAYEGFYSFSSGGYMLTVNGEEGSRTFSGEANSNTKKIWMKLAEKSPLTEDDYLIYML